MNNRCHTNSKLHWSYRLAGGLQLLLLTTLLWLSADAHAHEQFHGADHHHSDSPCVISSFAQSKVGLLSLPEMPGFHRSETFFSVAVLVEVGVTAAPHSLSFSCGPPAH